MSIRYGETDCKHVWRLRKDGDEGECAPIICIECGAYGCACDIKHTEEKNNLFNLDGFDGDANINNKWSNPRTNARILKKIQEGEE